SRAALSALSLHDALPILDTVAAGEGIGSVPVRRMRGSGPRVRCHRGTLGITAQDAELVALRIGEHHPAAARAVDPAAVGHLGGTDRKSTRLNSSHVSISY